MSEDELLRLIVRRCRLFAHGRPAPAGSPDSDDLYTPRSMQRTRWNEDEFSRGCYSFVPKGVTTKGIV